MRTRQGVLHLGELDKTRTGEDAIGAVDPLGLARQARHDPVDLGDTTRQAPPDAAEHLERAVGQKHVVGVLDHLAAWLGRPLGAIVGAGQRCVAMREHVELEVVVGQRHVLEASERLLEWRWSVDPAQGEGGHAAQGHLRQHPKRSKTDARREE